MSAKSERFQFLTQQLDGDVEADQFASACLVFSALDTLLFLPGVYWLVKDQLYPDEPSKLHVCVSAFVNDV